MIRIENLPINKWPISVDITPEVHMARLACKDWCIMQEFVQHNRIFLKQQDFLQATRGNDSSGNSTCNISWDATHLGQAIAISHTWLAFI